MSRNVDPIEGAVVTFGSMHAGTTNNVIAETAFLHGTIRTLTMEMNLLTQKRVKAIAEGVAAAFDVKLNLELKQGATCLWKTNQNWPKNSWTFSQLRKT